MAYSNTIFVRYLHDHRASVLNQLIKIIFRNMMRKKLNGVVFWNIGRCHIVLMILLRSQNSKSTIKLILKTHWHWNRGSFGNVRRLDQYYVSFIKIKWYDNCEIIDLLSSHIHSSIHLTSNRMNLFQLQTTIKKYS